MGKLISLLAVLVAACGGGSYGSLGDDGGFGATPGGVKDLTLARDLIAQGMVPPPDAILVEAMYAEHDLPLDGAPCARTLCLRAAGGIAPQVDGAARGWAQVGMSSTIDPATWTRPSTSFIFVVDVSGSMRWEGVDEEHPSGGLLARRVLHGLADRLRTDDRVAIVTYGDDVSTPLGLTSGGDVAAVHAVIEALDENGSTNMEAGMRRAYDLGRDALGSTEQVRVIVFTDVQPNVGFTEASEFEAMVEEASADGVHTTTLAFGLGIGPEVMRGMASLRGANAYGMTRTTDVDEFLADDYPWFTTPIAFDLRVNVSGTEGWGIDRGFGFPAGSDAQQQGLKASSVFLSKRRGAMLVAFAPTGALPFGGQFDLTYREPGGQEITDVVTFGGVGKPDQRGHWFAQDSVARTTALGLFTEAMHEATVAYQSDHDAAAAILAPALERFTADAAALADDDLPVEVELGQALLALIEADAPQGTLYGE
jgi:Ca-activated chloride channel homolog